MNFLTLWQHTHTHTANLLKVNRIGIDAVELSYSAGLEQWDHHHASPHTANFQAETKTMKSNPLQSSPEFVEELLK